MTDETIYGKVTKRPLPKTLDEIAAFSRTRQYDRELELADPVTAAPYVYRVLDEDRYELCATFDLDRDRNYDLFWNHPAGRHCFIVNLKSPP